MNISALESINLKSHWSHADSFDGGDCEYIKSFIHHQYAIHMHTHSFYELNVVLGGNGRHNIEQMSCEAKPGCVFVIPPNVRHGYTNNSGLDVYHMLIHRDFYEVYLSEFRKLAGFSMFFEIEPYLRGNYRENLFLILTPAEMEDLQRDIDAIDRCFTVGNSNVYINAIAKKILSQFCLLMTQRKGVEQLSLQPQKELGAVTDCLNYIHLNYNEKITIELLAEKANMSRSSFIRHFERICSCSIHQYIQQYRLKRAQECLNHSNKSFTAIAQECGFYDASHLRKCLDAEAKRYSRTGL